MQSLYLTSFGFVIDKIPESRLPHLIPHMMNMCEMYELQGHHGEVEQLLNRILKIQKDTLNLSDLELSFTYEKLAKSCQLQEKFEMAEEYLTTCLEVRESNLGSKDEIVAQTLDKLAKLFTLKQIAMILQKTSA